jgi:hypothetical protein
MRSVRGVYGQGFGRGRYRRSGFGFELVAAEGAVGAAQVAGFPPGSFQGAEGGGNVLGELWAGGGVHGCGGREALEISESVEGLDKFLGVGQNGDDVGLGNWYRELGEFFPVGRRRGGRDRGVFPEGG